MFVDILGRAVLLVLETALLSGNTAGEDDAAGRDGDEELLTA